ncbi:hypothetical protein GJ633_01305, partial [Halorubrum sp. CBA1125]|nr:hypothetical protein [Halorubrum sp. CBA1125]
MVRTMATRDIYETGFDEDVRTESSANQCPECDGRVRTNAVAALPAMDRVTTKMMEKK